MDIFGPSGETRTRGLQLPKLAPYQLGNTRKCAVFDFLLPKLAPFQVANKFAPRFGYKISPGDFA